MVSNGEINFLQDVLRRNYISFLVKGFFGRNLIQAVSFTLGN